MARRKFLNTDDVGSQTLSTYGSNTWYFFQDFVSQYKGIITHLKLWTGVGATRYGFYRSDDSSACLENTTQTTVAGTTEIEINTPFSVDASEVIQVALQATVSNSLKYYADSSNPWEYYYAATLPDTIGASYGTENRTEAMESWGYPQPEISSVNGGSDISDSDTNVPIVGTDFVDFDFSSVNPKVYLCPTSTFGSEVEQTVTNTNDSSLEITVDSTGLTPGTVYLFVKTGLNQFSEPIAVTLSSGSTVPDGGTPSFETGSISFSASGNTIPDSNSLSFEIGSIAFNASGYVVQNMPESESPIFELGLISFLADGAAITVSSSPTFEIGNIDFLTDGLLVIESESPTLNIGEISFSAGGLTVIESESPIFDIGDIFFNAIGLLISYSESPALEIGTIGFASTGYVVPNYPIAVSPVWEIGDLNFNSNGLLIINSESIAFEIGDISFSTDGLVVINSDSPTFELGGIDFEASGYFVDNTPRSESPVFSISQIQFVGDGFLIIDSESPLFEIGLIAFSSSGYSLTESETFYTRQIVMVKRLIAKYGQWVTWREFSVSTPDETKPWNTQSSYIDYTVKIVFLPFDRKSQKTIQAFGQTEIPTGEFYGLMGAVNFTPSRKGIIIRNSKQITVKDLKILEPDGSSVLYTIGFEK